MTEPTEKTSENDNAPNGNSEFSYEEYFKSKEAFLIFVLLYVDKEKRADLLGIHQELYESKVKAREWRNRLVKLLHSDHCKHLSADEATAKLNGIYARMKKHAK